MKYPLVIPNDSPESLEIYYKKRNRLFTYESSSITSYNINEILGNNRDLNIVYGLPYSGKTVISKNLEAKYGYTLIDFADFIEKIKEIKAGPEGDKDSITVDLKMFLEEFQIKLNSIPLNQKILLENITKIVTKEEELLALLEVSGPPRIFFNLCCDIVPLIDRYKTISGNTDEMTDEQRDEYTKTNFEFPKKIIDILNNQCIKRIDINSNNSETKTLNIIENLRGKKFVAVNHEYNIELDKVLFHIATTHKILYINIPSLIKKQIFLNTPWATLLKNSYMKVKAVPISNKILSKEEEVYYTYNPIHYDHKVIGDLITWYVNQNSKENENNKNLVLLTGYFNSGLCCKEFQSLHLPLLEVNRLLSLGIYY